MDDWECKLASLNFKVGRLDQLNLSILFDSHLHILGNGVQFGILIGRLGSIWDAKEKLNEIWDECTLLFDNLHEYPMPLMIFKAHRVHKFWGEHTDFLVDYSFLFVKRTVYKHGKCTTTAFGFLMHYFRLPLIHPIRQLHQIPYKWMSRLKLTCLYEAVIVHVPNLQNSFIIAHWGDLYYHSWWSLRWIVQKVTQDPNVN